MARERGQKPVLSEAEGEVSSVQDLIELAKSMAEGDFYREVNIALRGKLAHLADYINRTRKNLQLLDPPLRESVKKIPRASYQLTDIFSATEEATHKILSLTEEMLDDQSHLTSLIGKLQALHGYTPNNGENLRDKNVPHPSVGWVPGDRRGFLTPQKGFSEEASPLLEQMNNINLTNETRLIDIMTTLSFQDITGQKIKKISQLIDEVETRLLEIIVAFGIKVDPEEEPNADQKATEWMNKLKDSSGSKDTKQDLVDQILAEFDS